MKKGFLILSLLLSPVIALAAGGANFPLEKVKINLSDKASLQRGARMYMNYCSGCHSLHYMRYSQLGRGIGLVDNDGKLMDKVLQRNLMFTDAKVGDLIKIGMSKKDADDWFGITPPDLTLVTRVRGADWVYTYLHNFYRDDSRPWGSNNWLFPDVGMPNVLAPLQGEQSPAYRTDTVDVQGKPHEIKVIDHLQLMEEGSMQQHEFDAALTDLVNFMVMVGEPMREKRITMGMWVIGFLCIFTFLAYRLKKEFWQDVE